MPVECLSAPKSMQQSQEHPTKAFRSNFLNRVRMFDSCRGPSACHLGRALDVRLRHWATWWLRAYPVNVTVAFVPPTGLTVQSGCPGIGGVVSP